MQQRLTYENVAKYESIIKECLSILRDEASVYFNVTAVHV